MTEISGAQGATAIAAKRERVPNKKAAHRAPLSKID
jgi:hypothetical protein